MSLACTTLRVVPKSQADADAAVAVAMVLGYLSYLKLIISFVNPSRRAPGTLQVKFHW
jgi:hypothetical protein